MAEEDFYTAVELAKQIERKMLQYAPFDGKIEVTPGLDFYPKEYADMDYGELLNYYERIDKVRKASKMNIYAVSGTVSTVGTEKPESAIAVTKEAKAMTAEIESKVKAITTTSLENAEEMKAAAPIEKIEEKIRAEEKPEEKEPELGLLEFEKPTMTVFGKPEQKIIEKTSEKDFSFDLDVPAPPQPATFEKPTEKPIEKKEKKEMPQPVEERIEETPVVPVPEAPGKVEELEEHIKREWGGEVDEQKIKKKMLELTKALFKEKSVNAREKIKNEIVALKGLLSKSGPVSAPTTITKATKGAAKNVPAAPTSYSPALFESLKGSQNSELVTKKDAIVSDVNRQVDLIKKKFQDAVSTAEGADKRVVYEKFVFELTSLSERMSPLLEQQQVMILQKHNSELERFVAGLPREEKILASKANDRIDEIKVSYKSEFENVKEMLAKQIEALIDRTGAAVFKETQPETKGAAASQVLAEINETDEATLLYYLHSADPELYKKYERKHISRHEAIHYAKMLMAKDKGLSEELITKYFGQFSRPKDES